MAGIQVLNISNNKLQEIPKNTFPKLYELHTIDMAHNEITHISGGVLQNLLSLRYMNLSNNLLKEINATTFGTLPTILEINLNENRLRKVSRNALIKLSSLRSITMENNQLTALFEIPISLNILNVHNNRISEIAPKTWPVMNSLIELNLSNNLLGNKLCQDSFNSLMSLRHLNINSNNISKIPEESFLNLPTLQHLHLEVSKYLI